MSARRFPRLGTVLGAAVLLLCAQACSSRSSRANESGSADNSGGKANTAAPSLIGAHYCVETMMQGPPSAPVHFSYKVNESDGSSKDFEGDLAGDKFDLSISNRRPATDFDRQLAAIPGAKPPVIQNGFADSTQVSHYQRSDAAGWTMGGGSMVQAAAPWGLFILKPPSTPVGTDNVNGYPTIKYAVDTTHQSQLEKSPGDMGWGVKDYNITGSVWVTKDTGCILQYDIDLERDGKDGKISKSHYEGRTTRG